MLKRFLTEYQHSDGSRWMAPDFYAASLAEAQVEALRYPVQPIIVVGEYVSTILSDDQVDHLTTRKGEIQH